MALMAAETLGIDYHQIRSIVADTSSVGYTHVTGGSRVTFATGMAVVEASKKIVDELDQTVGYGEFLNELSSCIQVEDVLRKADEAAQNS